MSHPPIPPIDNPDGPITRREFYTFTRGDFVRFKGDFVRFEQEMTEFKQEMTEFKQEMTEFKDNVYGSLDHITGILERLDQERLFTNEGLRRLEETDENHEKRIVVLEQAVAS